MFLGQGVARRKKGPPGIVLCFPENGRGTPALLLVLSSLILEAGEEALIVGVGGSHVRSVSETRGEAELQSPGYETLG